MNNQPNTSNLLKRDTYKMIKRMEREQLSAYISNIYIKGFEAGRKAATPNTLLDALRDTLISVADIGPTRADAIIKRLSEAMKLGGAAEQPKTQEPTTAATDAVRYKALGNSIAIPPWKWVLKRLCAYYERDATMASLFDGIGGFPLIWEQLNGCGSCLWASEIEEFPLAVTKKHFQGVTA